MRYEDGEETARVRMTERRGASGVIESRRRRRRWREGQMDGLNRLACVIRGGIDTAAMFTELLSGFCKAALLLLINTNLLWVI